MNFQAAEFIKSAASPKDLIANGLPQVVFSGKSNVGKSSVINRLLNRGNFARVSSTPGKTVHINYFLIDKTAYFVDLPGYGYAKAARTERYRWAKLMDSFFSATGQIALGILIVDARHKPTNDDVTMFKLFSAAGCRLAIVANKTDKVKNSEKTQKIYTVMEMLGLDEGTHVIPFSAEKGTNRDILLDVIENSVKLWNS